MKAKIVLATIVAMMMVAVMAMPATADGADVPTSATIDGGNIAPEIQYSWELPDDDPDKDGTQVEPVPGGTKLVYKYIVVCHPVSADKIGRVDEVTYYPGGSEHSRSEAVKVTNLTEIEQAKADAVAAGLINQSQADEIDYKIDCNLAAMYKEINYMDNCDPPGTYEVVITACAVEGAASEPYYEYFEYLSGIGFEIDFSAVNYGLIIPCVPKEICGDLDMTTANKPTIENTCNDPIKLCVNGTDMEKVGDPNNVIPVKSLDAKLDGELIPELSTTMQCFNLRIAPCSVQSMSFSMHAPEGTCEGDYSGAITLEIHHG